jgi:hypothetical protein
MAGTFEMRTGARRCRPNESPQRAASTNTDDPDPDPAAPRDSRGDSPRHANPSVLKSITSSGKCRLDCTCGYRSESRRFGIPERLHTEIAFSIFDVEGDPGKRE